MVQGGSWPQGYSPGGPSTPTAPSQHTAAGKQAAKPQTKNQQQLSQGAPDSQVYRQTSQQSYAALSPQVPYNKGLTKQSSVSSIRDVLMTATPSGTSPQQPPMYGSPVLSGDQPIHSPMTPSVDTSSIPNEGVTGHHPARGNVLSPPTETRSRQDKSKSLSRSNSKFKGDKSGSGDSHSSGVTPVSENEGKDEELNSMQSPVVSTAGSDGSMMASHLDGPRGDIGRPDNLPLKARSPSIQGNRSSPSLKVHGKVSDLCPCVHVCYWLD